MNENDTPALDRKARALENIARSTRRGFMALMSDTPDMNAVIAAHAATNAWAGEARTEGATEDEIKSTIAASIQNPAAAILGINPDELPDIPKA